MGFDDRCHSRRSEETASEKHLNLLIRNIIYLKSIFILNKS